MRQRVAQSLAVLGMMAASLPALTVSRADAQTVSSDQPAGIVVFPRIVSDPNDLFGTGTRTETVIQLTNTDDVDHFVHCFYVNATGICPAANTAGSLGRECRDSGDCTGTPATCERRECSGQNISILLTAHQTLGWTASAGISLPQFPPSTHLADGSGLIPPVGTEYFEGELKCIEVDGDPNDPGSSAQNPLNANDLQGNATIYRYSGDGETVDVASYNGVGIQAASENGASGDKTLCLGSSGEAPCVDSEYAACPARLILDHWFEGAAYTDDSSVSTSITFAPCTERFATDETDRIVLQVLVFNEFEQRFSTQTAVECVTTIDLADLGTLFLASTQGTLTGQTSFRPVAGPDGQGVGVIAVAEETITRTGLGASSTAFQVNQAGMQEDAADVITYVLP